MDLNTIALRKGVKASNAAQPEPAAKDPGENQGAGGNAFYRKGFPPVTAIVAPDT